ncbi:MAG: hypothetical protein GW839_01895 [Flavobacteriales bacterium]|nr:hypothetical protein [Flavobacteriia bacterium]NCP06340.1 hypothetical protein [Flavobacteriales bacterium]PIV94600.1 MAG: hypothetical protein COW44_03300 [Flavobacteriaceae bacterium CG17_big_fil_post_rev_8_21_14_2_50_33_15]PIY11419.1 MAG: hypothetical protein COZ17_07000 [Flavobacteriaceae bacterium CG_4_10_14_3_um_filter_33_47]PJB19166.1 MAG: hypothetical protein CO117_05470 [Flavobacteriaceae bacterium CG_4_9_14_3_um_filter_33_16]
MEDLKISKKKPSYPVNDTLHDYLSEYNRNIKLPIFYEDLLRFQGSITVYDAFENDTLWIRVYYSEFEREEIDLSLKKVYTILHSDGNESSIPFLNVDAIDYCTFGNSKPFRIKVRNILNDNFTYFYIKRADASRVYGLELEHMLSPYNLNFLVYKDTLIEEHISGIPGDDFIKNMLPKCSKSEKSQIAKEFVKFNERCMIRLLGDMRSYNYVIVPTHDFDQVVYRIRAIDFDQQSYEGKINIYRPQFFKENFTMVKLVTDSFQKLSIDQYKIEERSIIAKRFKSYHDRIERLMECMANDTISTKENIDLLKSKIYEYTLDVKFKRCKSMGDIIKNALAYVLRNYENVNPKF